LYLIAKRPVLMRSGIARQALVLRGKLSYTTIPNHAGDMPEGTLRAILKQAGVDVDDFLGS
jgi:hypothetical protein